MTALTKANVDVRSCAFTTKSLYVGHMDFNHTQWQVIDTPGIIDHPLEDRNIIEMRAVTALAHLPCVIIFIVDVSGTCGYTVKQQPRCSRRSSRSSRGSRRPGAQQDGHRVRRGARGGGLRGDRRDAAARGVHGRVQLL